MSGGNPKSFELFNLNHIKLNFNQVKSWDVGVIFLFMAYDSLKNLFQ